jgi:hypothetical protein
MKKIALIICTTLVTLLPMPISYAGVVIDQRVKDREGKATQVILYCSGTQLRTDHMESGLTTIMDFKGDRIILIDHPSKNYLSMKLSVWEKEIAKQLKKDPLPLRPKDRGITMRRLGETAILNGFKTEKIQILADGELIEEHWMTKDIDMGEVDRVMEKATQGFSKEFRSEIREGQEIQKKLKPYGFSILVKDYTLTHGLGAIDVLEIKKIEQKDLKEEVFSPPSGYERVMPQPPKR